MKLNRVDQCILSAPLIIRSILELTGKLQPCIKSPSGGSYGLPSDNPVNISDPSDKIFLDSKSAADKNKSVFLKNISAEGGSYCMDTYSVTGWELFT